MEMQPICNRQMIVQVGHGAPLHSIFLIDIAIDSNMKTYICQNCGRINDIKGRSYANKYCNNRCQHEKQNKDRVAQWMSTSNKAFDQIPGWIKKTLIQTNGHICQVCKLAEWQGRPITLECDHIDGDHSNNRVDNLRLICPNCHSQTLTYKNKNKGKGRASRMRRYHMSNDKLI